MSALQTDANRRRMLAEVRRVWIDGYLKHSLDNLVRIELGLEEKPDAVSRPWDLIVQQPNRAARSLPPGQAMSATFDELGQALLILGAPGSGKTTLLLELTRDLLDRADQDVTYPIPVVFHLSSWAIRRRLLADWLVDELTERYYVSRKLAQIWIDAEQVLPLLDGLDEVAPEHRVACVEAINRFRSEHALVPLAVCSRAADYKALAVRTELSGSVGIQPLSRVQVSTYLKQAGKALAGVRTVLRDDETLWELLETPLMLSIVALTYQGRSASEVRATVSLEQRRTHLFENYTERMFQRRTEVTAYTREQTLRWLIWLARSLIQKDLSVFYVEWMQPDWLPSRAQRWIVAVMPIMFFGLVGGLVVGLVVGLPSGLVFGLDAGLKDGLGIGLGVGLVGGLGAGLESGLKGRRNRITPAEALRWSWRKARQYSVVGLVGGLVVGLWLAGGLERGVVFGLERGLVVGLVGGVVVGLVGGLTTDQIVTRTIPNEGIRRSLRNALISLLTAGLVAGLVGSLVGSLIIGLERGLGDGLAIGTAIGLLAGLVAGLLAGLVNGGSTYVKHYTLRFLLCRNKYAPPNYIRFLDYAAERVFLRKVGGGYIFAHRLLMEYFATLQPTDQTRQTQTA